MPTAQLFIATASISGLLAVALGAFGAHGLKNRLTPDLMDVWHTAVQYHFWHTLALLGIGVLLAQGVLSQTTPSKWLVISGLLFTAGIVIFSGSLSILCLSGMRWLGAFTPIVGTLWLMAWACLCYSAFKSV